MTAVNNLPDGGGTNSLISSLLSSLQASLGNNGAMQGLFASLLSQNAIHAPAANPTQGQSPAANGSQNASTGNGGNSTGSLLGVSTNAKTTSAWVQIGKAAPHSTTQNNNNTSSNGNGANNNSANNSSAASGHANGAGQNANTNAPANQDQGPPPSNGAQTGNQNIAGADGNSASSGNSASTATGNANGPNDGAIIVTAAAEAAVAPSTSSDPSTGSQNTAGTQGTDSISVELLALLMQLERLAAAQAQATQAATVTDPTAPQPEQMSGTIPNANADPGSKIDLKALLDAVARLKSGDGTATDPTNATGNAADVNRGVDATAALAASSVQNTQSSSSTAQAQQTIDKLANAGFFNLLNFAANNQTGTAAPLPVFNAAAIAGAALDGGNGGTDANMQGQSDAGLHTAAGAMTDASALPLPAAGTQAASPYDFASQLSALRATQGGTTGLPTPVEQVVLQLSRALSKDGDTQMTIQLKPAELGRVDVKLTIGSDGKVQGTVTADNSSTLGLLLKDVRGLERALQEAGLRADPGSLQFGLRGDGQPGGGFGQPGNNQAGFGNNAAFDAGTVLPVNADAADTYYLTPGGVNMRV